MDQHQYHDYDAPYRRQNEEKGGGVFVTVVIVIVALLLAALCVGLFWPSFTGQEELNAIPTPAPTAPFVASLPAEQQTPGPATTPHVTRRDRQMPALDGIAPELPFVADNPIPDIFDAAAPGVVGVVQYTSQQLGGKLSLQVYGSGSGFIISSNGYILTNAHVIEGAEKVTVLMDNGDELDAAVIGADAETDIAVLKIDKTGLPALELGDSEAVRVGEYVLAIGNPLDADRLANTLTFGIISAKSREITIDSYTNTYLQTDAAINYGNSGGPLLNMQGQVIGINSAKTILAGYDAFGNPVSAEGIGFAMPINVVKEIMEALITKGYIERPGIGIVVSTITEAMAEAENVPVGAYVTSVVKGKPASNAGVRAGDIIVEANGQAIKTQTDLVDVVEKMEIGRELRVRVYREGAYLDLTIVVANKSEMNFGDVEG